MAPASLTASFLEGAVLRAISNTLLSPLLQPLSIRHRCKRCVFLAGFACHQALALLARTCFCLISPLSSCCLSPYCTILVNMSILSRSLRLLAVLLFLAEFSCFASAQVTCSCRCCFDSDTSCTAQSPYPLVGYTSTLDGTCSGVPCLASCSDSHGECKSTVMAKNSVS